MSAITRTFDGLPSLVQAACDTLAQHIKSSLQHKAIITVALSGGKTPIPVYARLGDRRDIEWSRVNILLVDERYVPRSDPDNNMHMLQSTLLKTAAVPASHIIAPQPLLPLEECVQEFAVGAAKLVKTHPIDVVFLGIGDDGHIASLFPPLTDEQISGSRVAVHTVTDRFAVSDRITLTLPVLQSAQKAIFLFHGESKCDVWYEMLESDEGSERWPAKAIIEHCDTTVLMGR